MPQELGKHGVQSRVDPSAGTGAVSTTPPSVSPVAVRVPSCNGEAVELAPGQDVAGDFGRLAEADREHARSPADRGCPRARPCRLRACGGSSAEPRSTRARRLVEQQDATDARAGFVFTRWSLRSSLTARSIRLVSWAAFSGVSSKTNSSRGACRSRSRRPTSPRRKPPRESVQSAPPRADCSKQTA